MGLRFLRVSLTFLEAKLKLIFYFLFWALCSQALSKSDDRYELTRSRMPLVFNAAKHLKNANNKVVIGLPLTFETLMVVDALRHKIPNLVVIPQSSGENSSIQPGVFPYLKDWKIPHFREASDENRLAAVKDADIIVDCSFMLGEVGVRESAFKKGAVLIEDTKTGENRIDSLKSKTPIDFSYIILDNSFFKRNYENRKGIGYSVIASLMSMGFYFPFYKVGVIGYGYVGSGVAEYARNNGAEVTIVEIDVDRIKAAHRRGFQTKSLDAMLNDVDIVITATGKENVLPRESVEMLNKRLIVANAGGEEEWVRQKMFANLSPHRIHDSIYSWKIGSCDFWEIGGGNSVNLVSQISITEFLDVTFAHLIRVLSQVQGKNLPIGKNELSKFDSESFRLEVYSRYGDSSLEHQKS